MKKKIIIDINKLKVENNLKDELEDFTLNMIESIAEEIKKKLSDNIDKSDNIEFIITCNEYEVKDIFETSQELLVKELLKFYNKDTKIMLGESYKELIIKFK